MAEQGLTPGASTFNLAVTNGTVTITNERTGRHHTFQVSTALGGSQMGKRLVKVLVGPDPEAFQSWTTFGLVQAGRVQLWARWNTKTYQGYARLLERPAVYQARGYRYEAAVWCRRCNGPLKNDRSLRRGLDGICQAYKEM